MDSRVCPMHDRCGAAGMPSARISRTAASVPSCVEPPAPKVTEQNPGFFAYLFWSLTFLLPIFLLVSLISFR